MSPATTTDTTAPTTNPRLANAVGDTFRSRHASHVRLVNDLTDTLIGRAHAPEPGDAEAAVGATMELVALGQAYSSDRFAADSAAAIELRHLMAEAHAAEAERVKLLNEVKKIRREIDTVHGPNPIPNSSRPIEKKLSDAQHQIHQLDSQHAARHVRFKKLANAAPRVLRALTNAGCEARLKEWGPSLAICRQLIGRPG
jgi:hypothetical protein